MLICGCCQLHKLLHPITSPISCQMVIRWYFNSSDAGDKIFRLWESIPCLLMHWLLKSPVHQQAWYLLCRTDNMKGFSLWLIDYWLGLSGHEPITLGHLCAQILQLFHIPKYCQIVDFKYKCMTSWNEERASIFKLKPDPRSTTPLLSCLC